MGLDSKTKKFIKERFPAAFGNEKPKEIPLICADFMQYFKGSVPDNIVTHDDLYSYYTNLVLGLLKNTDVLVVCIDKSSPEVKAIVTHGKRYERRCDLCRKHAADMPSGKTVGPEYFSPQCEKNCVNNQIFHSSEGPHLLEDSQLPLKFKGSSEWMRFASDSRNLREELYPRIVNRLLSLTLPPGKVVYINGFPIKTRRLKQLATNEDELVPDYWLNEEMPLRKDSYDVNHTLRIEGNQKTLIPAMYNTIAEADHAIFYFLQFFPQYYRQMVFINDGDAISIGLTVAKEYMIGPEMYTHELVLCLPTKLEHPRYEYVNLTYLCHLIEMAPEFVKASVQSPVMTYIFLITLTGTDFFNGFCPGIGYKTAWKTDEKKRERQTPGIWDTFFDHADMFAHLIQFYVGERNVTTKKRIVIDEALFAIFVQYCYMGKYGPSAKKKHKSDEVTFDLIKLHCSNLVERNRPPNDEEISVMCRRLDYNLDYIENTWKNKEPDPFEQDDNGIPYYGYHRDLTIATRVSPKQKDVDEICKGHFWKRKQKQETIVDIPEKRKRSALEIIKGF